MQKQIHLINNPSSGTKGASLPVWQQFFIKLVSPKLVHFNKPMSVALISFFLTVVGLALIYWGLYECKTEYNINVGSATSQMHYVASARSSGKGVCLFQTKNFVPIQSQVQENLCVPASDFVATWAEDTLKDIGISSEDLSVGKEGIKWCDGAEAASKSRCEKFAGGTCPVCTSGNTGAFLASSEVFSAGYEVKTCPSIFHVFFWTWAVATHLSLLVTLIVIIALMAIGYLKQYSNGKEIGLKDALTNDLTTAGSLNA